MSNALRSLARPFHVFEGALTFWYMPYTTLRWNSFLKTFEELVPRNVEGNWPYVETIFVLFEGNIVDLEFAETLPPEAQPYAVYWQGRTGVVAHDWQWFQTVFSPTHLALLSEGYDLTRDKVLVNPNGASEDPEALSAITSE